MDTTLAKIKTIKEKNEAILQASDYFVNADVFSASSIASVDTDGDNKADFYSVTATQEEISASEIELDDDIDGDGILDTEDTLPYFNNTNN